MREHVPDKDGSPSSIDRLIASTETLTNEIDADLAEIVLAPDWRSLELRSEKARVAARIADASQRVGLEALPGLPPMDTVVRRLELLDRVAPFTAELRAAWRAFSADSAFCCWLPADELVERLGVLADAIRRLDASQAKLDAFLGRGPSAP